MDSTTTDDVHFPLTPCTTSDIPSLIGVYESAFAHDPVNTLLWPPSLPVSEKHDFLTYRFQNQMALPEIRCFKITDAATGEVAAWVRWGFPYAVSEAEKEERRLKKERDEKEGKLGMEFLNMQLFNAKFGKLDEMREKWVKWDQTYVCHLMVTSQSYQRKGFAKRLINHVLDIADAEGRPAYIEATDAGHPVYLKLGFKDIDSIILDLSPWGGDSAACNMVMMRQPVGKA